MEKMQLEPVGEINAAPSAAAEADRQMVELFVALVTQFPDRTFAARALIRFVGAVAEKLPAQQRLSIARAMLTEAARLGFFVELTDTFLFEKERPPRRAVSPKFDQGF
jgi:hypothetical protein